MATPTFAHDFKTSAVRASYRLPLKSFVGLRQGQVVAGASLAKRAVTGLGFNLSLYTMHGAPNAAPGDFGDGPFKLQIHNVRVE